MCHDLFNPIELISLIYNSFLLQEDHFHKGSTDEVGCQMKVL